MDSAQMGRCYSETKKNILSEKKNETKRPKSDASQRANAGPNGKKIGRRKETIKQ